ncbi:MAG: type II toxin-antitoxin system prevent-host-death family antitoxin [Hyphomonadaceae bacterium]|jgi:prevent-host-death family protein|nr:type II toxin-antitoxin system prevent-host-death family antitoxin [Hyphomonadaceae bacterium]
MSKVLTITATEFKAKCLDLMDQVAAGTLREVSVTKRGKPVAALVSPERGGAPLTAETFFGWAADEITIPDGLDLTAPVWGDDFIEARDGDEAQWLSCSTPTP